MNLYRYIKNTGQVILDALFYAEEVEVNALVGRDIKFVKPFGWNGNPYIEIELEDFKVIQSNTSLQGVVPEIGPNPFNFTVCDACGEIISKEELILSKDKGILVCLCCKASGKL